jgi:hypothetical protein
MEPFVKDQPKHLVTRLVMVAFGPWDRHLVRSYAHLSGRELRMLLGLLFACATFLPHVFLAETAAAFGSSAFFLLMLVIYLFAASHLASQLSPDDPRVYFGGAVMLLVCLAPITLWLPELMPPGANMVMSLFAGAWMGLRLARLRTESEAEDTDE